ncbi:MAG: hypothetical protein ACREBA_06245 [Nitrosotalea sp.]
MKNTRALLAIPLVAIAVLSVGVGMSSNAFATTAPSADNVDPQGQNDGQYGDQTGSDTTEQKGIEGHESSNSAADKDNIQQ